MLGAARTPRPGPHFETKVYSLPTLGSRAARPGQRKFMCGKPLIAAPATGMIIRWLLNPGRIELQVFLPKRRPTMRAFMFITSMVVGCSTCLAAGLPRSEPEAQGVSSSGVLSFVEAADKIDSMNSFM